MRKKLAIAAGALGMFGAGALVALPPATSAPAAQHEAFKVFEKGGAPDLNVDVDGDGHKSGVGDYDVGHGALRDPNNHDKVVGSEIHSCLNMFVRKGRYAAYCHGDFLIQGRGKIEVAGRLIFQRGKKSTLLAITGGTGDFKDATGTMKVGFRQHGSPFVFQIDY